MPTLYGTKTDIPCPLPTVSGTVTTSNCQVCSHIDSLHIKGGVTTTVNCNYIKGD